MKRQEENHTLVNSKAQFQAIPFEKRGQWIEKMLTIQQLQGIPKQMFKSNYQFESVFDFQGVSLHYYFQKNSEEPEALLFIFHGLNGHGGYSGYFGVNVAKGIKKINVYALDFKNYGKSGGGYKGIMSPFEQSISQAENFISEVLKQYKNKPKLFLAGESFGGTISFKMVITEPQRYAGIIFLAGGIRECKQADYLLKKFGLCLGCMIPNVKLIPAEYTNDTKYHMPEIMKADQLIYHGDLALGTVRILLNAIRQIQTEYERLKTPYILFQGGVDKIIDPFAALDLEKQSKVEDKTTFYFKNMWHNIFFEEEIQQIVPLTIQWLQKRI